MEKVYICGHKNPDTDSVASAVCYAYLKTITDPRYDYEAIRCGNLSDQTKYIFERAGVSVPPFLKDIYPKVADGMTKDAITVNEADPVSKILKLIQQYGVRITPVVDGENNYKGMAGITELSELFLRDDRAAKPIFTLRSDTLKRSLKAEILNSGDREEFQASIVVATMPSDALFSHMAGLDERKTIIVTGYRRNILSDVFLKNFPAVVLVGLRKEEYNALDFKGFKGWVFASPFDSAQTIRCIEMATPVWKLMTKTDPLTPDDYLETASEKLRESNIKSLPVVKDGKLIGVITSTDMLKKQRRKLIMMDHNEITQAIDGSETAEIVEIVDHHRLGTVKTMNPVYFYAKPVGSTCTLVYQLFKTNGITIPKKYAMLLLGGMISDTVILKSPTTTKEDHAAVAELQEVCGIDAKEYGVGIFSATNGLSTRAAGDILTGDFKIFEENNIKFGISQVETVTLREVEEVRNSITEEMQKLADKNNLKWAMILITDIIKEESLLLTTGFKAAEDKFAYKRLDPTAFHLPGVLSRKKQLLPEILRVLEELQNQ